MSDTGRVVRCYRPSLLTHRDLNEADREVIRLANLERYILRAREGLPIFEEGSGLHASPPSRTRVPRSA